MQARVEPSYEQVRLDISLTSGGNTFNNPLHAPNLSPIKQAIVVQPEEEIGLAAGCWIWDYLRRSGQAGAL